MYDYSFGLRQTTKMLTLFIAALVFHPITAEPTTFCSRPQIHCGDNLCCCRGRLAHCSHLGDNLTYIPQLPQTITDLSFTYNSFPFMSRALLQNASKLRLRRLELNGNNIQTLATDTFQDFKHLTMLSLSDNGNINKTDLSLALGSIPRNGKFKELKLEKIELSELSSDFFLPINGSEVEIIILNKNQLISVDMSSFRYLPYLEILKIDHNLIQDVNTSFGHDRLVNLSLMGNSITGYTPIFCTGSKSRNAYPSLQTLYLNENYISILYSLAWNCLKNLRKLDLGKNSLRKIPDNVFSQLPNLEELRLNKMVNTGIKLSKMSLNSSSLQILQLSDNNIIYRKHDISMNYFKYCPNLKRLYLSKNNFKKIDEADIARFLSPLTKLEILHMVGCHLSHVPPMLFVYITNLTQINLDGNGIQSLDGAFEGAKKLEKISLQGNVIKLVTPTTFPISVQRSLKAISLANNPYTCTCDLLWFRTSIGDDGLFPGTNVTMTSWPWRYTCHFPTNRNGILLIDYRPTAKSCMIDHLETILISVIGSVVLLTIIIALIRYRYRWYISYWKYRWRQKPRDPESQPLLQNHTPYTYIVYNDEDRAFVHDELKTLIEDQYGFKLHIWHRDAEMGSKANIMFDGIHGSIHVIAVISKNFMADSWCEFQLDVASNRQIELRKEFLTLIILEDIHKSILRKSWCVMLTRLETVYWCSQVDDIRRKVFEQQIKNRLTNATVRENQV